MLELNSSSEHITNKTSRLLGALVCGATILWSSQAAFAAPVINSMTYSFRTAMTNTGVDTDARGTVRGNLTRRGAIDSQRLTVAVSKLDVKIGRASCRERV